MNLLTKWIRSYLPALPVSDRQLAEDLTLRGIAVEGEFPASCGGTRFEMDITTNRVDAMNHYGVAREVAAMYSVPLSLLAEGAAVAATHEGEGFPVRIDAPDLCGRFTARIIRGVRVGPATGELAEYFAALGQKPISAPVDVTNFGWLAMGQPTHVFDLDRIEGGIVVRRAHAGETLRLLDGTERTLVPDDLVVADERKALGLAGVMGGWDSRVTEDTTSILVEAAWFDPAAIRASSRRHGLHTDASHRFERGADFAAAPVANNLVTRLVVAQSGGAVVGPLVDVVVPAGEAKTAGRAPVLLRVAEVRRVLGTTLDDANRIDSNWTDSNRTGVNQTGANRTDEDAALPESLPLNAALVRRTVEALGCGVIGFAPEDAGSLEGEPAGFRLTLPSWRLDLEREIDLIEEVARVYGYNRFANTLPGFTGSVVPLPHAAAERSLRATLLALGYSEVVGSTFSSPEEAEFFVSAAPPTGIAGSGAVPMGNPLSAEAGVLRTSLLPGMAAMLAGNLHRDNTEARLFETGALFTGSAAQVDERAGLAIGLTGKGVAGPLYTAADALFYELKGVVEALLARFPGAVTIDATGLPGWVEPGRGARALLAGEPVAWFGELAAAEAARRKLRQTVLLAEVNLARLLTIPLREPAVRELSRFQAVERDFSFLFPDAVRWDAVQQAIGALHVPELQQVRPVEVYRDPRGKAVAAGSYSLLLRVTFQSAERTLTEEELTAWGRQVTDALTALGGTQRA